MASKGDKDVVLDLAKYSDQRVRVKFQVLFEARYVLIIDFRSEILNSAWNITFI